MHETGSLVSGVGNQFHETLFAELIDYCLDVLTGNKSYPGHLRHCLWSKTVQAPEDATFCCCKADIGVNARHNSPQEVIKGHHFINESLNS